MTHITIGGITYETTSRKGTPAIRSLNRNGGTRSWHGLMSAQGQAVMSGLNIEPAMAPSFPTDSAKEPKE
jgi:hypothetical protein